MPVALLVRQDVGIAAVGAAELLVALLAHRSGALRPAVGLRSQPLRLQLPLLGLDTCHLGASLRLRGARLPLTQLTVVLVGLFPDLRCLGTVGLGPARSGA